MRRAGPWLIAAAIAFAAAAYAVDRFGYELCHRGLPLALLALATPVIGAMAGLAALVWRSRAWTLAIALAAVAANAYYIALALHTAMGVGFLSCGA